MTSEIRQAEKDKYGTVSLIHGIFKKRKKKVKVIEREWWLPRAGVGWGNRSW